MISLFFMSMVILASSSFKPVRATSTDLDLYCLDGVGGTWSWLESELASCLIVPLDVTGDDDNDDLSPGLDPKFNLLYRGKIFVLELSVLISNPKEDGYETVEANWEKIQLLSFG